MVTNKILFTLRVNLARRDRHDFIWLFHRSEFSLRTGSRLGLGRDSRVKSRASGTGRERSGEEGVRPIRFARGFTLRLPPVSLPDSHSARRIFSALAGSLFAGYSEFRDRIKHLQAKQRICRECKDYVIGREITTVLKITVDNAIL